MSMILVQVQHLIDLPLAMAAVLSLGAIADNV